MGVATEFTGLSSVEAAERFAEDGPNELPAAQRRSLLRQAWDVLRQPMLLLLVIAGSVNFVLAEPLDGAVLMSFVVVVVGISLYEEHKTENALAALRDLSAPRALVVRDGQPVRIAGRDVVRGDKVLLAEGDRVPADGVLVEAVNVSADESLLTGESVPALKAEADEQQVAAGTGRPGGDATPWVFSGTMVVKGHGVALVTGTGAATQFGRIGEALEDIGQQATPLQREIDRLVRTVAVIGLVAAATVTILYGLTRGMWLRGVLVGIGTAMAMLPEEFPVVLTVFLALGAWRLSRQHVLTRRAPAIEALGSATVVCVDKTGTLTLNRMTVREFLLEDGTHATAEGPLPEPLAALAEFAVLATPLDPFDPMDKAFRTMEDHLLTGSGRHHPDWELVREYPLSDRLPAMSQAWRPSPGADHVIAAKGAPEAVAELCHLDAPARLALTAQVERATEQGQRVLAVAQAGLAATEPLPDDQRGFAFTYLGLVSLHDPIRPGVAAAVAECARAGVRTVMITGDYPGTATAIAREIGLPLEGGHLTGAELEALADDELRTRVREVSVCARMVPEHKLRLVRALQSNGEIVAMTGDGVNDAPALRAAEIGIAMGRRGTDVAREAAALVITDDDFTSIARGIRLGRGIFANMRKAMSYIVAVHLPILGMSLVPVFVPGWPIVLLPGLIALLELIIDPACSVVFEAEPTSPHVMEQPPRRPDEPLLASNVLVRALLQGLGVLVAVLAVYLWAVLDGRPPEVVRTIAFVALVVGNLGLILVNRSTTLSVAATLRQRNNPKVAWILGATSLFLVLLLTVPALRSTFTLGPVSVLDVAIAVAAGLVGVSVLGTLTARPRSHRPRPS